MAEPAVNQQLDQLPVVSLKGVGEAVGHKLAGLGLRTVQDVLFHLPHRYQDRTRLAQIGTLRPGNEAVISVEVVIAEVVTRARRSLLVRVADGTGSLCLRFFHFSQAQVRQLVAGAQLQCFGEVRRGPGMLEMVHPEYRLSAQGKALQDTLTPFYPATEGVQQPMLRKLTDQALALLEQSDLADWLPPSVLAALHFPELRTALQIVHRPPPGIDVSALLDGLHPAMRRLAFEELVAHRLGLRRLRASALQREAPSIPETGRLPAALLEALPFTLTTAQQRVLGDLRHDMACPEPMLRLMQGDVGAGKTIVAALAAAAVVEAGYQVALMAPTEILAEQHLLTFTQWFEPLGVEVAWLTGKLRSAQRRAAIEAIALGRSRVVVGTHALFQNDVEFADLGLAIIDEQHRFGVHQRMALRDKGAWSARGVWSASGAWRAGGTSSGEGARRVEGTRAATDWLPHQLIMTATPIPRTLAMTAYADLDVSVINELPPGRTPVTTVAVDGRRREEVISRVDAAIEVGRQVYWVCTLIEESETLQAQAAEDTLITLRESLPRHRIALIHGRLKSCEKETLMQAFKAREIDLLVATTVIEVGVDVPNASLMIIENAERLGLSQLHQLRGRVGRGATASSCTLMYQAPLSRTAQERLSILRSSNDGFLIAQKDLELRGAGEVLGTRQTGLAEFRIAELGRDADLLDDVSAVADTLLAQSPAAVDGLIRRWIGEHRKDYGAV